MKKIKQTVEIDSNILEFHEKMLLMPLIETLAISAKTGSNVELKVNNKSYINISPKIAKKTYKILCDVINEDCNNFEFGEDNQTLVIGTVPFTASKLECVKILKTYLNIGLKEAKDLVDSCPTKIELSMYNIDESKYEELTDVIKNLGIPVKLER